MFSQKAACSPAAPKTNICCSDLHFSMGKTLKRQRQKQLREQQQQQLQHPTHRPSKLPRLANGTPLNSGSSSSKFTAAVSAALQDKKWLDAVTGLEAMQQYGKVPRLGAVQRWVRDADQVGAACTLFQTGQAVRVYLYVPLYVWCAVAWLSQPVAL